MTRAEVVLEALGASRQRTRGTRRLTLTSTPTFIYNAGGQAVGIETYVGLTDDGTPVEIDPHRVIINPPLSDDPREAFWDVLWAQVDEHPGTPPRQRKAPT